MSISVYGFVVFLVLVTTSVSDAFAPSTPSPIRETFLPLLAAKESLRVTTTLSPSDIANLASTPSHSASKSGTWSETIPAEETYTRFIVEGGGSIALTSADGETTRCRIKPGTLLEIKGDGGEGQLVWDVDDEMKILYSGEFLDEQQKVAAVLLGLFIGVAGLASLGMSA
mmetsp:Transcript_26748/g.43467  ORF Transcript_26748/g.43467 Transcript_26748/m.43467 type:complete len:170 (+) Transcript_26748:79-588(+)